jgi:hypothetical protein
MVDLTASLERCKERVNEILSGASATPEEVLDLVKCLHRGRVFGLARALLDRYSVDPRVARSPGQRLAFAQKRALSTYKDPDLQADRKLDRALRILGEADDLGRTVNQETLGLAGAIHKRMWEVSAQERNLSTALAYYLRGYQQGVVSDYGYTAINSRLRPRPAGPPGEPGSSARRRTFGRLREYRRVAAGAGAHHPRGHCGSLAGLARSAGMAQRDLVVAGHTW